jgi:hypothetical protein
MSNITRYAEPYNSFEEWKMDLDRMRVHPNDKHLAQHVSRRIDVSDEKLKGEIRDFLLDKALEENPWMVLQYTAAQNPNHRVVIRSPQDPWFMC